MQIELLQEFIVLSVTKNFSDAAVQLNLSQPSLSRHMDLLEKELGFKLLNRTRPLTLTPHGKQLLPYATETVDSYSSLIKFAQEAKSVPYVELKIQDLSWAPPLHKRVKQAEEKMVSLYPEVSFRYVEPKTSKDLSSQLRNGDIDIAFVSAFGDGNTAIPQRMDSDIELVEAPWSRSELVFVGRMDNPLLNKDQITLEDFKRVKFMSLAERHLDGFRESFSAFCEAFGGFSPVFDFRTVGVHSEFYAQDPGQSVFIMTLLETEKSITVPDLLLRGMRLISFGDYFCTSYVAYSKGTVNPMVEVFAKSILGAI